MVWQISVRRYIWWTTPLRSTSRAPYTSGSLCQTQSLPPDRLKQVEFLAIARYPLFRLNEQVSPHYQGYWKYRSSASQAKSEAHRRLFLLQLLFRRFFIIYRNIGLRFALFAGKTAAYSRPPRFWDYTFFPIFSFYSFHLYWHFYDIIKITIWREELPWKKLVNT